MMPLPKHSFSHIPKGGEESFLAKLSPNRGESLQLTQYPSQSLSNFIKVINILRY